MYVLHAAAGVNDWLARRHAPVSFLDWLASVMLIASRYKLHLSNRGFVRSSRYTRGANCTFPIGALFARPDIPGVQIAPLQ